MSATVFLGGGRITSALAAGLRLAGDRRPIVVYDRHPQKLRKLERESQVTAARDLQSAIAQAGMLIVAVRPASVEEVLAAVAACGVVPPRLCVSLAAGIPLKNLKTWLGPPVRWARAMPSPVCRIARGLTALCFEPRMSEAQHKSLWRLFKRVGDVREISERKFDAFSTTFSSSHGYHALRALAKAAQHGGLDQATALVASAHALADGIFYWQQGHASLQHLLEEAATPGGIAAATMRAMDRAGYTQAVRRGIQAGIERARRNASGAARRNSS